MKFDRDLGIWVNAMHVWCTKINTLRSVPNYNSYVTTVILLAIFHQRAMANILEVG